MIKLSTQDWDALRRFKPTAEAFVAIGPLLDTLGDFNSLEQAFQETNARLNDKRELEKQIDDRLKACEDKENDAARLLMEASLGADEIRSEAYREAEQIKKSAEKDADTVAERARADAKRLRDQAKQDVTDSEKLVDKSNTKLLNISDLVDKKSKELEKLNADLDAAKSHIAVLLRGKV